MTKQEAEKRVKEINKRLVNGEIETWCPIANNKCNKNCLNLKMADYDFKEPFPDESEPLFTIIEPMCVYFNRGIKLSVDLIF